MIRFAVVLAFLLTGCMGMTSQLVKPVTTVNKAVAETCVKEMPEKPKLHTDAEIKKMPDYQATITLIVERVKMEIYEDKLESALEACRE